MELSRRPDRQLSLVMSEEQLLVLMAAVRESFAAIPRAEFKLRIGASVEQVDSLAGELKRMMIENQIEQ